MFVRWAILALASAAGALPYPPAPTLCIAGGHQDIAAAEKRERGQDPRGGLKRAIELLTDEATAARGAARFEHDAPDFSGRFTSTISSDELSIAIVQRQHADPFIDSYIRWQLTSFDPPLPEMDDPTFLRMMDATPAMVENPRAADAVLNTMAQVERAGSLAPRQTEKLRAYVESLNNEAMLAEEMNRPAREWRAWMAEKLGETGQRPRLWMVENLAATILAGWPVSELKGDISRDFSKSLDDQTFTAEQRQGVVFQLSRLIGPGRRYFYDVTYFADGSAEPAIRTSSVDRDDVENWRKRLAGIRIEN